MNITDLNTSSTLGKAIKADTARLPLIDERVSTIAHHADNQQVNEEGKPKVFDRDLGYQTDPLSCSDATKRDSRLALPVEFFRDTARYDCEARRRHRPVAD